MRLSNRVLKGGLSMCRNFIDFSPRDRVISAIKHQQTDICPYYVWMDHFTQTVLEKHYCNPDFTSNYLVNHIAMFQIIYGKTKALQNGRFIDSYGSIWEQGENMLHLIEPALTGPVLKGYSMPDIQVDDLYEDISLWLKENKSKFKIVQLGMSFFERAWAMRGFENFLIDLYENPLFVEELLDGLEEVCNKIIDRLIYFFPDQIDAIGFSDDYGAQRSMIISPELWRKFMKPHLARMYEKIKKGEKYVYLHSCGHITPIIPELIDIGVDMLQPIQPEAMNIFNLKHRFVRNICLVGGISTQKTLPYGSPLDIINEVNECLNHMAKNGGYVMAPAKAIPPEVPLENVITLVDSFVKQRGL